MPFSPSSNPGMFHQCIVIFCTRSFCMAPRFHHIIAASLPTLNSSMNKPSYTSLPLAGKSSALNFAQGLHSAQNGDCAKDSHWEENVSEGHAAVVEEVDELDRKN